MQATPEIQEHMIDRHIKGALQATELIRLVLYPLVDQNILKRASPQRLQDLLQALEEVKEFIKEHSKA